MAFKSNLGQHLRKGKSQLLGLITFQSRHKEFI
ncbi:hypothetical protein NEOC65_000954 [Neochlamydia sp. AcF65]|nr:hypothetical protein [Neochlamydia sp. AcF65]MBS4170521.1 hypothetical protein [Neochlamydia sp. AcF95]